MEGVPQLPIGSRTDVLDRCPKAEGHDAHRSMAPQVLVADEIARGRQPSIGEALHAGIKVITTAHGQDRRELLDRPVQLPFKKQVLSAGDFFKPPPRPGTLEASRWGAGSYGGKHARKIVGGVIIILALALWRSGSKALAARAATLSAACHGLQLRLRNRSPGPLLCPSPRRR